MGTAFLDGERRLVLSYAGAVTGGFLFMLEVSHLEPEAVPLADAFNLTPRELEVLLWVSRCKTNRDIGDILGLSPRTVNKHLEHIYEKLGVETRTAAAALAMRVGFSPSADIATDSAGPVPRQRSQAQRTGEGVIAASFPSLLC